MTDTTVPDPMTFLAAVAAVVAFAVTLGVLYWVRSSRSQESMLVARQSDAERAAATERRRREAELEKAVAAGTHLPDGRQRCQASQNCTEHASRAKPRIVRDEGMTDFVRRAFGAPRRYRMVEPGVATETTGLLGALVALVRAVWGSEGPAPAPLRYCDVHVHIARQVCLEQLSADEHAEMIAQSEREARLTYFESAGLEKRIVKIVNETELRDSDKKRRKGADAEKTNVVPFGRATSNGASAGGALS